ncbi:unnamed protein product [Arctogadus glacialis]
MPHSTFMLLSYVECPDECGSSSRVGLRGDVRGQGPSVFGNTGDGKSQPSTTSLWGASCVLTSKSPRLLYVGLWAAYDPSLSCWPDKRACWGQPQSNQRMRLLLR